LREAATITVVEPFAVKGPKSSPGVEGLQGPASEVTTQQLTAEIATPSSNPTPSSYPSPTQIQAILDPLNPLLTALSVNSHTTFLIT
jgi:hypothetical protein